MDNIQYYHGTSKKGHRNQFTLAIEIPNKEHVRLDIWKLVGDNIKSIPLKIGKANVSKSDNYNKNTGRVLSNKRLESQQFELISIGVSGDNKNIRLTNHEIIITLQLRSDRDKVYLIDADVLS